MYKYDSICLCLSFHYVEVPSIMFVEKQVEKCLVFFKTGATLCKNIYVMQEAIEELEKKMLLALNGRVFRNCFKRWGNLETVSRGEGGNWI